MPMPKRGHVRRHIYVKPDFWDQVKAESKERKVPIGMLVEEAFAQRVRLVRRPAR